MLTYIVVLCKKFRDNCCASFGQPHSLSLLCLLPTLWYLGRFRVREHWLKTKKTVLRITYFIFFSQRGWFTTDNPPDVLGSPGAVPGDGSDVDGRCGVPGDKLVLWGPVCWVRDTLLWCAEQPTGPPYIPGAGLQAQNEKHDQVAKTDHHG